MSRSKNKPIAITLGDPCGIGPEIISNALAKLKKSSSDFVVIGDETALRPYQKLKAPLINLKNLTPKHFTPGQPNLEGAKASLAYLNEAIRMIKEGTVRGMVTGPLSKEAVTRTGIAFQGHTEYLAEAFGVKQFGMMFVTRQLKTIVVTRHIPIAEISLALTRENVFDTIQLTDQSLRKLFRLSQPVIAVCGLNPHAGEGGTIGKEELEKIIPAIQQANKQGIEAIGPFAADTLFVPRKLKKMDAVVAMYHDQGLIPIKSLFFSKVVNLTVGLPFIRTSPAHGTAFDIAGQKKADCSSMIEALSLAAQLSL